MQNPGQGTFSAGADVRRSARDRSGDADSAKQCGCDIRDALGDKLHVIAVLAGSHSVGHLRR